MRYLTVEECHAIGLNPYAVYAGLVYSFKNPQRGCPYISVGSVRYLDAINAVERLKASLARPAPSAPESQPLTNP